MSQQPAPAPITTSDRIWTIPNIISFIRLLGVPLFLYLLLVPQNDVAAVVVLAVGGTTDWVDGYVARRLGQVSRLGELLDPFADRLYILAILVGFTVREVVPWWLTGALLLRELVLGIALLVLRRHGYGPPAGALPRQDRHVRPARRVPGDAARGRGAGRRAGGRADRLGRSPGGRSACTGPPPCSI